MKFVIGIGTMVAGIVLVLRHVHVWRKETDATTEPKTRAYLLSQLRRRMLTSTCIAVLGFIVGLLHFMEYWKQRPIGLSILFYCCIALSLMIFVLAALDILAVSNAARKEHASTGEAARELAREYERLKGKADKDSSDKPE